MIITEFGDLIAERMRAQHRTLAQRWLSRLEDVLPVDARDIFPTESLLDHIPALIIEISEYLRAPDADAIAANTAIMEKARELGALRHAQRASLHQLLREYQLLSGILATFVIEEMERLGEAPSATDSVRITARLHQAVDVLAQATIETFVTLYTQTIADQRERLEQFTRMAAHEWRQPLGALQFAVRILGQPGLDAERAKRTLEAAERNVHHLVDLTHKLETIARVHNPADNLVVQEVSIAAVASEAARQLREMAEARGVEIRVADTPQTVVVDVGRLELVFVNLISNAIKYSDESKTERYVSVSASPTAGSARAILVEDNGVGIPPAAMETVFKRFTRAHTEHEELMNVAGIGLGLSIVDDCVRAMRGRIEVASTEGVGTSFLLTLPAAPTAAAP